MDVCMDIWTEQSQINRVLNEICRQLGMLRCKFYVVLFLGNLALRTSASGIRTLGTIEISHDTHTCMYIYICLMIKIK